MAVPVPAKYIADFEKLGFGMFVHWGLYSQHGRGEWALHNFDWDLEEYKRKYMGGFTAEDFDAEELVLTAKSAGCKYITFTTRHHEGFSLYDTCGLTEYDAPHSPAKRDLVREFLDACNKHGIVPMLYHTTLDWSHPDYKDNFDAYLEYLRKSVELLCKNYGKIGGFWFDGNWDKPIGTDWKEDALYAMIRSYQPEAMIIVNPSGCPVPMHKETDAVEYEMEIPAPINREGKEKYVAGEMCYTINDHWGYCVDDINYKSPHTLLKALCHSRRVGANLLLNIGPMAQGGIDPYHKQLMGLLGKWMAVYGEAVYNGKPYPSYGMGQNFILRGEDCLYLFFTELGTGARKNALVPNDKYFGAYSFGNVTDEVESICWMDDGTELPFVQSSGMLTLDAQGFYCGLAMCVRVAKAMLKK